MSKAYQEQKAQIAGLFSQVWPTYDEVGPPVFGYFGRRLVEFAEIKSGDKVLDVAAGKGAVLFPAAERVGPAGRVIGIDLSAGMVAETRRRVEEAGGNEYLPAEIYEMDAENLEYSDSTFDNVLCGFALFFFPHREQALAAFRRVLKSDGRIAVTTWGQSQGYSAWLNESLKEHLPSQISQQNSEEQVETDRPLGYLRA
jgi:ubiquinone/menaquinone biosynthesis C-methylase UbiE